MDKDSISIGGLYKNLIVRVKGLAVSPQKEWSAILSEGKTLNDVLTNYSLPLIGIYTITVFIGYLMGLQQLDFQLALREAVFTFSSCFFGLYVSYFLLLKALAMMGHALDKIKVFQLVAYSSGVLYITGSLVAIVPETIVIAGIINLYVVYLIWQALHVLKQIASENRIWLSIVIGLVVLLMPSLISRLFMFVSNLTV
ncbi:MULTISPECIES: YIP1 family protein [unclassified Carboxylicivirga]|uniref:YIP1 family protein n=1 Tax=Carboxylicivirga TaxID=1628153 RepID=UPI003D34503A